MEVDDTTPLHVNTPEPQHANGRVSWADRSRRSTSDPSLSPNSGPGGPTSYEEFFGGTIPCPTCRGHGRIPQDKEHELVALIPVSDKRLKPRRTTLYVIIAIMICLLIGALLAFFLFPRGVILLNDCPTLKPTYLYVNTSEEVVNMTVVNVYNISNRNFYPISVQNLSVTLTFDMHVISQAVNTSTVRVPLRTNAAYEIAISIPFSGDEGFIAHYCADDSHRSHTLLLPFTATLKTTYFGGLLENTLTTYQHVKCGEKPQ